MASPTFSNFAPYCHALFQQDFVGIVTLAGPEYIIERINPLLNKIWGRTYKEVVAKPLFKALPELVGQGIEELLREVYKTGTSYIGKQVPVVLIKDQIPSTVYFDFIYVASRNTEGMICGITVLATDVTEQVLAKLYNEELIVELKVERNRLNQVFEEAPSFMATLKTKDHVVEMVNKAFYQLVGHRSVIGKKIDEAIPEIKEQGFIALLNTVYETGQPFVGRETKVSLQRRGTSELEERYVDYIFQPLKNVKNEVSGVFAHGNDVTERVAARKYSDQLARQLEAIFESVKDFAIFTCDLNMLVTTWNEGAERIFGYSSSEIIGKSIDTIFIVEERLRGVPELERKNAQEKGKAQDKRWHLKKDGSHFWADGVMTLLKNEEDQLIGYTKILKDETDRKAMEEQMEHQALHDSLTDLPNRLLLEDRIKQAIATAELDHEKVALMFLDLDRFKLINDSLGHHAGDELLRKISDRLRACVREDDTVARFGGDEFVIVFNGITHNDQVKQLVAKIFKTFEESMYLGKDAKEIYINTSIGISLYPDDGMTEQDLLKNADLALYHAKESGRKSSSYFSEIEKKNTDNSLNIERDMRRALLNKEFVIYYQPIVSMQSGKLTSLESLVRWNHPTQGLLLPNVFLSYAEDSGLIHQLGEYIIETICCNIKDWEENGYSIVPIAINLSQARFYRPDFLENIKQALIKSGLKLNNITVEVTENLASRHRDIAIEKLCELRDLGIGISLDDFGTGNSSLTYLRDLPIDEVKIDKSFLVSEGSNYNDAIVRAIYHLAKDMGYSMVIEGIENRAQLDRLRQFDYQGDLQGFFFSEAMPHAKVQEWLQDPFFAKKLIITE